MRFLIRRQPHFVIQISLLEYKTRSTLQVRQQAAANFHVVQKIRFQTRHIIRFFVDPDDPGKFLDHFFHQIL